jgi:hypothetical protein
VLIPSFKGPGTFFHAGSEANGGVLGVCNANYQNPNYPNSAQVGKYLSYSGLCDFGFANTEVSLSSGYEVLSF